jgi:glycosyltransferase involved in cell wall biosynthesis
MLVDQLTFLYHTSFTHDYSESGWQIQLNRRKLFSRLSKHIVRLVLRQRETLIIQQKSKKKIEKGRPRIVHIIGKIGGIGGSQKIIFDLVSNLSGKYEMEIITLSELMLFNYPGLKVKVIKDSIELKKYIDSVNPAIVHLHYYGDWFGFHDAIKAILKTSNEVRIIENINVPIQMYYHPRISEYIHVSKNVYDLQKIKKGKVIYPGVDTEVFKPSKDKVRNKNAGFVYRLFKDKIDENSFKLLIEIAKKDKRIKIIIVGYGKYFSEYFSLVSESGVRNQFEFIGDVKYDDLQNVYKNFSVFLAAVHTESYGLVVPYAMSMGIPVVAKNVGALPEILGNTNYLCSSDEEFTRVAVDVLNKEPSKSEVKSSRDRVLDNFSLKKMISDYDKVYKHAVQ